MRSAIFLDRDGVINDRPPEGEYVRSASGFRVIPGVVGALRELRRQDPDVRIVLVTNQRGIARGMVSAEAVDEIHELLSARLAAEGASLDRIYVCPHDLGMCDCRKPAAGLFHQALADFPDIDPQRSVTVGDSAADLIAGRAVGTRVYLVGPDASRQLSRDAASAAGITVDGQAFSLADLVSSRTLCLARTDPGVIAGAAG